MSNALNEDRGANPGDTHSEPDHVLRRQHRSTKAGARTPATPVIRRMTRRRSASRAQRRPGREPRRHWSIPKPFLFGAVAQRRPGREPRRHLLSLASAVNSAGRSTKAGARTPATPPLFDARRQSLPRSTKAGARTPATLVAAASYCTTHPIAQRRPGREPRRHSRMANSTACTGSVAQRRPGREPRRHRLHGKGALRGERRSTKAGARTPATLPGLPAGGRARDRSTKAGARTPGDTTTSGGRPSLLFIAQRRPGREPRRHSPQPTPPFRAPAPLNEGRGANPGDTLAVDRSPRGPRPRSTKAGARTPATRLDRNLSRVGNAQRRPGREPRRHLIRPPIRLTARPAQRSGVAPAMRSSA